jgi:hypothetical protein
VGEFGDNKMNGRGRFSWAADESYYEEAWSNDNAHGYGVFKSYKETYEGQWCENKKHGKGKLVTHDGHCKGDVYIGDFTQGKVTGLARFEKGELVELFETPGTE